MFGLSWTQLLICRIKKEIWLYSVLSIWDSMLFFFPGFLIEWQKTMLISIIVTYCYHIIVTISQYCYYIYDKNNVFCYTCEEEAFLLIVFVLIFNKFQCNSAFNFLLSTEVSWNVQTFYRLGALSFFSLLLLQCSHYDAFDKDAS